MAINQIKLDKECGLRQKDKTDATLTMMHGEDHGVVAQRKGKISEAAIRKFNKIAQDLLNKQRYFTEEQLRKEYCKRDHNVLKADAEILTRRYLANTVKEAGCIKTRVNQSVKERYSLPKKIKSNSFIYVLKEDK